MTSTRSGSRKKAAPVKPALEGEFIQADDEILKDVVKEPWGLSIPDDLSYEAWQALGIHLADAHQRSQWRIGDWYNYGESNFGHKAQQAEAIAEAARANGWTLEPATVNSYAYVARTFPRELRKTDFLVLTKNCRHTDFAITANMYNDPKAKPKVKQLLEDKAAGKIGSRGLRQEVTKWRKSKEKKEKKTTTQEPAGAALSGEVEDERVVRVAGQYGGFYDSGFMEGFDYATFWDAVPDYYVDRLVAILEGNRDFCKKVLEAKR